MPFLQTAQRLLGADNGDEEHPLNRQLAGSQEEFEDNKNNNLELLNDRSDRHLVSSSFFRCIAPSGIMTEDELSFWEKKDFDLCYRKAVGSY